jgi:hypothetical protein
MVAGTEVISGNRVNDAAVRNSGVFCKYDDVKRWPAIRRYCDWSPTT